VALCDPLLKQDQDRGVREGLGSFVSKLAALDAWASSSPELSIYLRPGTDVSEAVKKLQILVVAFPLGENGTFKMCRWDPTERERIWDKTRQPGLPRWDFAKPLTSTAWIQVTIGCLGDAGIKKIEFASRGGDRIRHLGAEEGLCDAPGAVLSNALSFDATGEWALLRWIRFFEAGSVDRSISIGGGRSLEGHRLSFPLEVSSDRGAGFGEGSGAREEFVAVLSFWEDDKPRRAPDFRGVAPPALDGTWNEGEIEKTAKSLLSQGD
jgi:hypothetical protein